MLTSLCGEKYDAYGDQKAVKQERKLSKSHFARICEITTYYVLRNQHSLSYYQANANNIFSLSCKGKRWGEKRDSVCGGQL